MSCSMSDYSAQTPQGLAWSNSPGRDCPLTVTCSGICNDPLFAPNAHQRQRTLGVAHQSQAAGNGPLRSCYMRSHHLVIRHRNASTFSTLPPFPQRTRPTSSADPRRPFTREVVPQNFVSIRKRAIPEFLSQLSILGSGRPGQDRQFDVAETAPNPVLRSSLSVGHERQSSCNPRTRLKPVGSCSPRKYPEATTALEPMYKSSLTTNNTSSEQKPVKQSGTFHIGGDLPVYRLGFGAMRITGAGSGENREITTK